MKVFFKFTLTISIIFLLSCNTQTTDSSSRTTPLIPKDTSIKNERDNKLFVFVGEKIKVTPIPYTQGDFDGGVTAKYLIIQRVYGYYDKDTIEFEAYDHFSRFPFADYKNALLYVSEDEGKFYQEKYMYDPLFKTKDGRWAGPYSGDYGHSYNKHTTVKPEKIDFAELASFPTKVKDDDGKEFTISYPEPYYKIVGDKAIAIYGNYIPELFRLKKEGVLTARELFGDKKPESDEIELPIIKDTTDSN
jgi:hypothetical protein